MTKNALLPFSSHAASLRVEGENVANIGPAVSNTAAVAWMNAGIYAVRFQLSSDREDLQLQVFRRTQENTPPGKILNFTGNLFWVDGPKPKEDYGNTRLTLGQVHPDMSSSEAMARLTSFLYGVINTDNGGGLESEMNLGFLQQRGLSLLKDLGLSPSP